MDEAHVTTLSVHPDHQGERIGTRLLPCWCGRPLARGTKALTLEVRAGNEPAQALYRRFGFAPAGIRKNYYAEVGEDALIMWAHDIDGAEYAARLDGHRGRPAAGGGAGRMSRPRARHRDLL